MNNNLYPSNYNSQSIGQLICHVCSKDQHRPIEDAKVSIRLTGNDTPIMQNMMTDSSGYTVTIELPTPDKALSLEPTDEKPYGEYTITVYSDDYDTQEIIGTQLFADTKAIQHIHLNKASDHEPIIIPPHSLAEKYSAKIPEEPIKIIYESDELYMPKPIVPEYITVHDGDPNDATAPNYYILFKDYIKNVLSQGVYPTWPKAAIEANALAIISFAMNRIYTDWYRNRGKTFTITSMPEYDQKFVYGRNIYENISQIVDVLFINYVAQQGIRQPILTQYCDGYRNKCPDWLNQWGSKDMAGYGSSVINILRNYYGPKTYIATTEKVSGIPVPFPGYALRRGSKGLPVTTLQKQLNKIGKYYPDIPELEVDGIFGPKTQLSVEKFQELFYMPVTGIVDYPTWYRIADIYVKLMR